MSILSNVHTCLPISPIIAMLLSHAIINSKMSYFRESFKYQPMQMFLNSNATDIIRSCGDVTFNHRRKILQPQLEQQHTRIDLL